MKPFTVRMRTVGRGPKMRARVMARSSDAAWNKVYEMFCRQHPRVIERRISIGGIVSDEQNGMIVIS